MNNNKTKHNNVIMIIILKEIKVFMMLQIIN